MINYKCNNYYYSECGNYIVRTTNKEKTEALNVLRIGNVKYIYISEENADRKKKITIIFKGILQKSDS